MATTPADKVPDDGDKPTLTFPEVGPIPEDPIESTRRDMPSREEVRRDLPDMADMLTESPSKSMDSYDMVMTFIRAQGAFIRAQSYFLEQGRTELNDKLYIQHLTGFATAQATLIRAQQDFLRMFGAM